MKNSTNTSNGWHRIVDLLKNHLNATITGVILTLLALLVAAYDVFLKPSTLSDELSDFIVEWKSNEAPAIPDELSSNPEIIRLSNQIHQVNLYADLMKQYNNQLLDYEKIAKPNRYDCVYMMTIYNDVTITQFIKVVESQKRFVLGLNSSENDINANKSFKEGYVRILNNYLSKDTILLAQQLPAVMEELKNEVIAIDAKIKEGKMTQERGTKKYYNATNRYYHNKYVINHINNMKTYLINVKKLYINELRKKLLEQQIS